MTGPEITEPKYRPVRMQFTIPRPELKQTQLKPLVQAWDGEIRLHRSITMADALLDAAEGDDDALEAATDLFAEWVGSRVSGIRIGFIPLPGWLVTRILDALLPGVFMGPVRAILARLGYESSDSTPSGDG